MQSLPSETLRRIFFHTLPIPIKKSDPPYHSSVSAPLGVAHVCQKWRSLTLSYGELWSYLCMDYRGSRGRTNPSPAKEIFDAWLSRTNGAPISFTIHCTLNSLDKDDDHHCAEYLIRTLLQEQHRWKEVDFNWCGVDLSPNFPGLQMSEMPMLTSLSLVAALGERSIVNLAHSPHLRRLDLRGHYDLLVGSEPLRELTESCRFEFSSTQGFSGARAAEICLNFLEKSPFLTEFEAKFDCDGVDVPSATPIILRDLRTLKLLHSSVPSGIVDNLTVPSLEALQYSSGVEESVLLRFIQRSTPPLTYLALHDACGENDIIAILRLLPALTYLRCAYASVSERFFHALTVESEDNALLDERIICPKLGTLHLRALRPLGNRDAAVDALVGMLKSRANIQESFETIDFKLDVDCGMTIDISELDGYSGALKGCFWGQRGQLIAGDHEFAMYHSFPPPRSNCVREPSPGFSTALEDVPVDEELLRHFFPNFRFS